MATLNCPSCGKSNPDNVDICQYCGTVLKRSATEPLPPIHPGDMPVKKKTSDLESTLPGWLRDVRRASSEDDSLSAEKPEATLKPDEQVAPPFEKPASPKPRESASPLDFLAGLAQANDEEEETPDWLKSIQGSTPAPAKAVPTPEPIDEKPADWLSNLQSEVQENVPPAAAEPDWGFGNQPTTFNFDENAGDASLGSQETPGWLSALQAQADEAGSAPTELPSSEPLAGGELASNDTPDWLAALSGTGIGAASLQPESRPTEQPPAAPAETPDWFASLGEAESQAEQPIAENAQAVETPDWLSSLGGGLEIQPEQPTAESASIAETPDWLSSLGSDTLPPAEAAAPELLSPANLPGADLPPWLSDLTASSRPIETPTLADATPSAEAEPLGTEVPDWMAALEEPSLVATENPAGGAIPEIPVEGLDWMAGLQIEPSVSQPTEGTIPAALGDSELPSWLAEAVGEKPAEQPGEIESPRKPFDTGALKELSPLEGAEDLPDWMSKLGETPEAPGLAETPAWLETALTPEMLAAGEPEAVAPAQPETAAFETVPPSEEQNLEAVLSLDMPDWLSGFTPTEAELKDAKTAEMPAEDDNIRPADLPSWVQAMRPVEDVMGEKIKDEGEAEQPVESVGPLAGLRSVLPAQSGAPSLHKPKTYSIKLQVDETQKAQAALLENILNSESTPQAVVPQPATLVIRPLRWAIAGILLVTVLLGALLQDLVGSPVFPAPDLLAGHNEIVTFKETIDNLSESSVVLVVADYQPGFAGEMEPAAGPVIGQLMSKNIRLAFISTSPIGYYLAERFVQKFAQQYPYEMGSQYVNLGYLPGGAGGIQVFAAQPTITVGRDLFLGNLWQTSALKALSSATEANLSSFSAVIILTDNPDTGRLWIEQAEPFLKPKPMLMVVSAQAEPMIRPYIASGQLTGMLSGLEDGVIYEGLLSSSGQARSYWDAFGVAVLAAELLIVVGGIWGLVAGNRARRAKKMEQDEA